MSKVLCAILTMLLACNAWPDGLPLKNGRYLGKVIVFTLTAAQKKSIEHFEECYLNNSKEMNQYTPYVFELTASQSEELRKKAGYSPKRFFVFQTYKGFNDAGPFWNLALRFSENEIEIPLDLLLSDKSAKAAHAEQGWEPKNPCFKELGRL